MKILLATYWPIPHLGGVWNYMEQTKAFLEQEGHEVDILGFGSDNTFVHLVTKDQKISKDQLLPLLEAKITPDEYPAIYANDLVKYTEFQRYVFELAAAYFGLHEYDLIHTQDVIATASLKRVKPEHIPMAATIHGSVAHEIRHQLKTLHKSSNAFMARAYFDELEWIGATAADVTITANEWLRRIFIEEFDVPDNRIKVLHYGFDKDAFLKKLGGRTDAVKPPGKKVIIYSGRLVELKGVHHLIDALGELKKKRDDWQCWIVGDGEKKEELRIQSKVKGLSESVFFFGKREDLPELLSLSDIFVLPSILENQPLSVIEAQIAGKAIIISDAGGLPEMAENGVTGLITPAGDSEKLMEAIEQLLENDELRETLANNAKEWAADYWDMKNEIANLLEIYEGVIREEDVQKEEILENEVSPITEEIAEKEETPGKETPAAEDITEKNEIPEKEETEIKEEIQDNEPPIEAD
ncbi:glycosyltransferase family 4 protein [Metabacillus kandeliae]|uniref:glycosyltransferase family 4 protein n=1 Tax=Metabacillus kandeliae TaxID=2900151 RepID=UPI002F91324E